MTKLEQLEAEGDRRIWIAASHGSEFFAGKGDVHGALMAVVRVLDDLQIRYALVGAMALNRYGHERFTTDVNILVTRAGLAQFKARALGLEYVEKFAGSKSAEYPIQRVDRLRDRR